MNLELTKYYNEFLSVAKQNKSLVILFAISIPLGIGASIYFMRKNRTVRFAKKFVGEDEIPGNMGFKDPELDSLMREFGDFSNSQAWCMSFIKMIWIKKFGRKYIEILDKLITPSTQTTFANFENDKSGKFKITKEPERGAIVIWQNYKNGIKEWTGHAGLVQKVNTDDFETIEGNTNDAASREGYTVAEKIRPYAWATQNGLRLKGFISLK